MKEWLFDYIENVRLKGIDLDPDLLKAAIDEVEMAICNEINHLSVPEGLKYVWASMVIDWLLAMDPSLSKQMAGDEPLGAVSSIHEGNTTISFREEGSSTGLVTSARAKLDRIILNYERQLQVYRGLRWKWR